MKEHEPVFLSASESAVRVARDPATIRRWAQNGQVRRRSRGRIVEYREDDLLAAAGLAVLDEKDRTIAQLRLDVAQAQVQQTAALTKVAYQREKFDSFQERLKRERGDYRQQIATLEAQLAQAVDVVAQWQRAGQEAQAAMRVWQAKHAEVQHRLAAVEAQAADFQRRIPDYRRLFVRVVRVARDLVTLGEEQQSVLTTRERRERLAMLAAQVRQFEQRGADGV